MTEDNSYNSMAYHSKAPEASPLWRLLNTQYLKLHEITICKDAYEGKIPGIRIGKVWRFNKEVIDRWITGGQREPNIKLLGKRAG